MINSIELNLLNERAIIGINSKILQIEVDGSGSTDRNFGKDPYFKIFDGSDASHSKNVTRISMYRPEYVIHNTEIWILDSKELNELIRIVSGQVSSNMLTWEYIQWEAIREAKNSNNFTKEDEERISNCTIPDYKNIHFSEKDLRKYRGAINSWHKKK